MTEEIEEFLSESNAIEGVYDEDSLKQAKKAWEYLSKESLLTPSVILKTHRILMLHQPLGPKEKGYFRQEQVEVGGEGCPRWQIIPQLVYVWCTNYENIETEEDVKKTHILFEKIHPFIDGNGRVGRMLLNWQRVKLGLTILIIKELEKEDYYGWFHENEDETYIP